LVTGGNKIESNVLVQDLFVDKVVIHLNVLSPSMVDRIRYKGHGTKIVTPNDRGIKKRKVEILQ
jgi:hypothetical protein